MSSNSAGEADPEAVPWLSRFIPVRRGELPGLLLAFLYFFFLLCAYYVLRPVRDEMGVRGGVENLQWLFTGTFIAMLAAVPVFAALVTRYRRHVLIPVVYGVFIACILGFWIWLVSDVATAWAARAFYVWLSVFNLFVVSVFWSFMADLFNSESAGRLFGAIAAGGSAGAILGPGITATFAAQVGPANLLPVSAAVLAMTIPCIAGLTRWSRHRGGGGGGGGEQAIGGTILEGVRAVATSRYLLGVCLFIVLYTTLSTFLYFEQLHIFEDAFTDSGRRTAMFAAIDLATNTLTVLVQLFVTARLVRSLGLPRTLALVPGLVAIGFVALAAAPVLAVIAGVQVLRRAGNYAVARPGREMLFTVVSRMEKYKSKNFIDTVVYRGGDAVAGWAFTGLTAAGLGLRGVALLAVPLAVLWLVTGWFLGRWQQRLARERGNTAERG